MVTTLLTTHHVGGRAGTRTFPSMKYFEKDRVNVLYEADESSISGIKKETHYLPSKTIILPDCLSGSAGKRARDCATRGCATGAGSSNGEQGDAMCAVGGAGHGWPED